MPWDRRKEKKIVIDSVKEVYTYESPFPSYDDINDNTIEKFLLRGKDKYQLGINELDFKNISNIFNIYCDEWNPSNDNEEIKYTKNPKFNLSYPEFDAFVTYSFIRHYKPKRIIEIGCGQSSRIMAEALNKNNNDCKLICIEPYTDMNYLKKLYPIDFVKDKLENIDLDFFSSLDENDILFIDSSHVLRPFGDVEYEYLHILPILKKGVIVHIHDIFYPYDYPKVWTIDWKCVLTEQQLLVAFLYGNKYWKTFCANNYLASNKTDLIPKKIEHKCGGSYWIRKNE